MSTVHVPQQPHRADGPAPPEAAPVPPHASEATRLLCAGAYVDPDYRDRVIDELYLHEQRLVAPSLGFDAARVLAHALRARRQELLWSAGVAGLWVVGVPVTGGLLTGLLLAGLLVGLAPRVRGDAREPPSHRALPASVLRWAGAVLFALYTVTTVATAFGAGSGGSGSPSGGYGSGDPYGTGGSVGAEDLGLPFTGAAEPWQAWAALGVLALIAWCEAARRDGLARAFGAELSPERFPDVANDPAEGREGERFARLTGRIRREQHAPLIMYDEERPFCGAGAAHDTWVLAVELRPDEERDDRRPLGNRVILDRIRPLIEQLREPAEHAGTPVRDRLRGLEIDECVFLPVEGLTDRDQAPYTPEAFERHLLRAVEEGGEKRRHFLRIRVGAWEEELGVTVYVRVHTQGRMLMLEIAPHVMPPVRREFKRADHVAHGVRTGPVPSRVAAALSLTPGSPGRALVSVFRDLVLAWRLLTGGHRSDLPEGPALSVRELAAADAKSTFQEMDVARYLRSIQDRVGRGVRLALAEAGYETGEFVQKIVNISNGAVSINRVEGSTFAIGENSSAVNGGPGPQRGASADDGT
ncbi:hypothetical protein [Streptomyces prasinopilosus]|uniref:Uncharacterized protein n=1 Tax=Streptomyces prasinopilosus TaxID=67344 RepID=A0A1G6NZZ3_9ACTN|nr:hypothetical protein [Streptomyces prasinopilosus]SDC72816.1 hypothetical protein SAMN05216505_103320 [Streptomyces prasinopilosus]